MTRGLLIAFMLSFGPTVSNSFARFAYALVLPAMRTDLQLDWSSAGWLNTANAIGYLGGALLARMLVRRTGNRVLFASGMVITAVALAATGLVRDVGALTVMRGLSGVGGAMVFVCGGALSGNVFPGQPARATTTIAIFFAGGGIGLMLCGVAVPLLLEAYGDTAWPLAWQAMGVASLAMAAAATWAAWNIEEPGAAPGSADWRLAPFVPQFLAYVCFGLGYIGYMTFVIAWMRVNGAGTGMVIAVWTVLGAATLAAPAVWAGPCERWRGGRPLAAVMAVLSAGAMLPMASLHPAALLASATLFGLAMFSAPSAVSSLIKHLLPKPAWGSAMATFTVAFAASQIVGPVATGWVADRFGSLRPGLTASAAVLLLGALLALAQRDPRPRPR
ncbi:MAG: YbfB/YjiJ family MFS transporter [Burkholderiales bacterium]|nr:MAG: YbfB/YjiJ family MFS transporter [Burkholderiales bacterium]